jgi:hypothetical protein
MFEQKLTTQIENLQEYTFYTVHGLTIESNFSVDVTVKLSGVFESEQNKSFPFIVRSPKNGDFIN